ncbi:MAG: AAA family ATPase [Sulfuritalea sp.]|nr:AAA family ATPase [Sulfuritalea sp.]
MTSTPELIVSGERVKAQEAKFQAAADRHEAVLRQVDEWAGGDSAKESSVPSTGQQGKKAKFDRSGVDRLLTIPAASVIPELIRWFWKSRIALGKLTLIAGDPGLGKSMLMASLAAHCSTGRAWLTGEPCPCGDVLFVSAEDDPADTIRRDLMLPGQTPNGFSSCSVWRYLTRRASARGGR